MRTDHCARCGYLIEYHDVAKRCPGMKTAAWQDRDPIDRTPWREILQRDAELRAEAIKQARMPYVAPVIAPPLISPRPPQGPHEFAGYRGKQAVGLGRRAVACGMDVAPFYGKRADLVDWCAVKGHRSREWAFVAEWERKPGASWAFELAYAWPTDGSRVPLGVGYAELLEMIR